VLVPLMLIYSILLMIEFNKSGGIWFYAGIFIFMHAFATLVYNWNRYNIIMFGRLATSSVPFTQFYDVFIEAPIIAIVGWNMMRHFKTRNRFMYGLSFLAILHAISTLTYNGYTLLSNYFSVPNIRIGGIDIFMRAV
jgi:hypothetical protein